MSRRHDDPRPDDAIEDDAERTRRLAEVGLMATDVAHEVNNLLGGILMAAQYAGTVVGRDDADATVARALADIETDVQRCSAVVRDLQRFARTRAPTCDDGNGAEPIESEDSEASRCAS